MVTNNTEKHSTVLDIPISEEELNELLFENRKFNWDFDGLQVCLFKSEERT